MIGSLLVQPKTNSLLTLYLLALTALAVRHLLKVSFASLNIGLTILTRYTPLRIQMRTSVSYCIYKEDKGALSTHPFSLLVYYPSFVLVKVNFERMAVVLL